MVSSEESLAKNSSRQVDGSASSAAVDPTQLVGAVDGKSQTPIQRQFSRGDGNQNRYRDNDAIHGRSHNAFTGCITSGTCNANQFDTGPTDLVGALSPTRYFSNEIYPSDLPARGTVRKNSLLSAPPTVNCTLQGHQDRVCDGNDIDVISSCDIEARCKPSLKNSTTNLHSNRPPYLYAP